MDNFKNEISFPRSGMSKGVDPRQLKENEYTYALNTNINSVDGDYLDLSYEKSNVLAVKFPKDFVVIGKFNRLLNNRTYYFLHNPITKKSKFGYVDNDSVFEDKIEEKLETTTQIPFKKFNSLLDDECTNKGFNFRIDKPIKNPIIKEEKTGGVVYFTDGFNPTRYITLDNIQQYFTREIPCDDDVTTQCPLFEKMLVHGKYKLPEIESTIVTNGGSLNKGSYSFIVALSDALGNEISEYYSLTQPSDIWEIGEGNNTNKAIKIVLNNLDSKYTHYKIITVYVEKDSRATTLYEIGIYPINQTEVIIGDIQYAQRTSIEKISFNNQRILTAEGLTSSSNSLMEYGITFEKEINLQPVVNMLGSYLEWQTHEAKEDLYEFGDMRTKYLGINRNEVVPYGIRFIKKGGTTTSIFPLVGREATAKDRELIPSTDSNRKSYETSDTCQDTIRNERWQYHNTSKVTTNLTSSESTEVVTESIIDCTVDNVYIIPSGAINIDLEDPSSTLEEYLDNNGCNSQLQNIGLCQALDNKYLNRNCDLDLGQDCVKIEDTYRQAFISDVVNESVRLNYENDFNQYSVKTNSLVAYDPYLKRGNGYVKNTEVTSVDIYEREPNIAGNNTLINAIDATLPTNVYQSNFKIFKCSDRDLLSTTQYLSTSNLNSGMFNNKITDNSQWFVVNLTDTGKFVSITKSVMASTGESFPSETFTFNSTQRVSFFKRNSNVAIHSILIDLSRDNGFLVYKETNNSLVIKTNTGATTISNVNTEDIYFVVEQGVTTIESDKCIKHATTGGYQVYAEDLVIKGKQLTFDNINISLNIKTKIGCKTKERVTTSCTAIPYQKGSFSYWESVLQYPDNKELYDSTQLKIDINKIPVRYRQEFLDKFSSGRNVDGTVKIKDSFNLTCKPIRHFKFPDNKVSPFMVNTTVSPFGESLIYPLGITINEDVINMFLDIAKDNNLITEEEREDIYSYEIFRGNLTTNRSIVASGLLYDFRRYNENGSEILYSNYPYNSFGKDYMNQLDKDEKLGKEGTEYTFHSPETDYTRNTQASEIKIEGYQFGHSKGNFDEVEEHPKWVVLTSKADNLASDLASIETVTEIVIDAAHAVSNAQVWVVGGLGSTGTSLGIPAFTASATILAFKAAAGILYRYAKYKQEWLTIIENLGVSHNFAYYYYSLGHYNYLESLSTESNSIRNIQSYKFIKDGRLNITNRVTKEKYDINNIDREWSTFIALGEQGKIQYPSKYSDYDKESIVYQSKKNITSSGRSQEVVEKIASMYAQLVNYNTSLHGEIGSINWVTTSHKGDLNNPSITLTPIFGGDTFISRHTLKRKIPLFLTTAMGQSGTTPFEYKNYNNIGTNPLFYVNYKVESDYSRHGKSLPTIKSEFRIDNETGKKFYYIAPSKFYLYYYGIPSFLTETRINTNFREFGRSNDENFYPNVGDIGRWTQETNVKLREPNYFKYDFTFSNQPMFFNYKTLPTTFKRKNQNIIENSMNGVVFSLPDLNENGQTDPWLKFKPLDFYEFGTQYGKLKELKGIENETILARFEHTAILYNKVSSTIDDGQTPSTYLGGKDIFQRRTASFVNSELGYGGTQHSESLSCEYGHFYADNRRGQIIQIPTGGGSMIEISSNNSQGKPTNMREWFKRHLPYKLVNSNIEGIKDLDVDNSYNYIGTTFGYDALHKRVLITKKDYIPVSECKVFYDKNTGFFTNECQEPSIRCPEGFEKVTEYINCGLRLALVLTNTDVYVNTSITFFLELLKRLQGNIEVSIYNSNGSNPIVVEGIDRTQAINFLNTYIPTTSKVPNLTMATCVANRWLNEDLTKNRVLHALSVAWEVPNPDNEFCPSTNTNGLINTSSSMKDSGISMVGTGDGEFLMNSGYFTEGMTYNFIEVTEKMLDFYRGLECDGEPQLVERCKKVTQKPLCPEGYYFDIKEGLCKSETGGDDLKVECECYVTEEYCECIEYTELQEIENKVKIELSDSRYFKEVSWTIAYYPEYGQFGSFYSFYPNYYVNHFKTFETGINSSSSLWSHNVTNKSFGVFYGKYKPMEIELVVKSQLGSYIGSIGLLTESKRFFENEDYNINKDLTFNKSVIYNRKECSGELTLDLVKGHTRPLSRYPITVSETEQRIPIMKSEELFNYNYFYNRVLKGNTKPFIKNDENEIDISVENISFKQRGQLGRLNGDYFLNRLTYDQDSRNCLTIKLQKSLTNLDFM